MTLEEQHAHDCATLAAIIAETCREHQNRATVLRDVDLVSILAAVAGDVAGAHMSYCPNCGPALCETLMENFSHSLAERLAHNETGTVN